MWLELYTVLLLWAWFHSLINTRLHVFVGVSVVYSFHYFLFVYNVSEPRPWPWLRGLSLWNRLHRWHLGRGGFIWAEGSKWTDYESKGPRIFVVESTLNDVLAMVLTFGLHGQEPKAVKGLSPLLVLPDYLFRVPLLANLLQWVGGVPFDKARLERAVKEGGASLVVILPATPTGSPTYLARWESDLLNQDDALERGELQGHEINLICTWLRDLPVITQQPIKVVPVVYCGAEHFYRSYCCLHQLGLLGTCIPRAVKLRVAFHRTIFLSSVAPAGEEEPNTSTLPETARKLLDTLREAHGYLNQVTHADANDVLVAEQ